MLWIILLLALFALFIYKIYNSHTFWTKRNVKQSDLLTNLKDIVGFGILQKDSIVDLIKIMYNKFPGERLYGAYSFGQPILIVKDPDLIKLITVKDFDHFVDHQMGINSDYEPLWTRNLFSLTGDKWKNMRATLSPAFTSSKMKMMFTLISEVSEQFINFFYEKGESLQTIELKDAFTRSTNDIIATCAFGLKCDSMRDPDNEFYRMGIKATNFAGAWKAFKFAVFTFAPKFAKLFKIKVFDADVAEFFVKVIADTVRLREEKGVRRPDMIQLLMDARKGGQQEEETEEVKDTGFATVEESEVGKVRKPQGDITLIDMTAQALIFFFAGFESVATLECFLGHELACHPDVQERLHKEVDETLKECNGKITYEALNKMKYLDMVVAEALRKWPIGLALDRKCVAPYTIQPENPGEVPVDIFKDMIISMPITGMHHDPQYYPNPEKFDPERFSDENKGNIKPYTYFPFGVGPRNCIASRFALLETKTMFFHLLSKFEFVVVEKTDVPIVLQKSGFQIRAQNGFWIGLKKRL